MSTAPQLDRAPARAQGHGPAHAHAHGHGHAHDTTQDTTHDHPGHDHSHHAHHGSHSGHATHAHTAAPAVSAEPVDLAAGTTSLLMRSAGARVAGALLLIGLLWLAVGWAVMERAP